jgi:hypothetical protein
MGAHRKVVFLLVAALAASTLANAGGPAPASAKPRPASAVRPVASFQEIMLAEVIPSSTALWNAVSTQSSAEGLVEHKPTTDEDWLTLRHQALVLIEAGNLLLDKDRLIVARGGKVKDVEQPGILGPVQIRQKMDADPARLARLIHALQDATGKALDAIEAKNADALSDAGGDIDEACEACHKTYWYPDTAQGRKQ